MRDIFIGEEFTFKLLKGGKVTLRKTILFMSFVFAALGAQASSSPSNPTVRLEQGITELCSDSGTATSCTPIASPVNQATITAVTPLDSWDGAPYIWISVGKKSAAICAAGEKFTIQKLCVTLKVDISTVFIAKSEEARLGVSLIAKHSTMSAQMLQRKASRFANSYAKAIEILHGYAQTNWIPGAASANDPGVKRTSIGTLLRTKFGANAPVALDDCDEDQSAVHTLSASTAAFFCDDDPGEGDPGGGDPGGGDPGGLPGGGNDGGYGEANPFPTEVDPTTGEQVPKVIIYPPAPRWPVDLTWCSLVGLFCSSTPPDEPDKAYCDQQRRNAYNHCTSIFEIDPNKLPGSGSDMPSRYRVCVREYLDGTGCHNY